MKKYKLLVILVAVLVAAGISLALASGNLQGLISNSRNTSIQPKIDPSKIRKISSVVPNNLGAVDNLKTYCNQSKFKTASILLVEDPNNVSQEFLDQANDYRKQTSIAFAEATQNLASMDTSSPLVVMKTEDAMFDASQQWKFFHLDIVTNNFYKTHSDDYDFIIIFMAFTPPGSASNFSAVTRQIEGIGFNLLELASAYGSKGKLKGIISLYEWKNNDPFMVINMILHEIGHEWAVGDVGDLFTGEGTGKLEIASYASHYYSGLDSPNEGGDPIGGATFAPNGDGTFKGLEYWGLKKYHPFTLYFMGILPKSEYGTKYQIYDLGPGNSNWEKAVPYKKVSVNDIIAVMGERKCK